MSLPTHYEHLIEPEAVASLYTVDVQVQFSAAISLKRIADVICSGSLVPAPSVEKSVAIDLAAHLAAAISLLERGGKAAKKAAPSDKMFDQMIRDYKASLHRGREAIAAAEPFGGDGA